jgi:hypothetical protein
MINIFDIFVVIDVAIVAYVFVVIVAGIKAGHVIDFIVVAHLSALYWYLLQIYKFFAKWRKKKLTKLVSAY